MLRQFNNQLTQAEIEQDRLRIQQNGQHLGMLKDNAIANNIPLPYDYSIRVLRLIHTIARHDTIYRSLYGADAARNRRINLGNLAITAKLLRNYVVNLIPNNVKNNYSAPANAQHNIVHHQGYAGTNIFDDLAYLCSFDIVSYDNHINRPLYNINDATVHAILDEICPALINIANVEISAYNRNPSNNLNDIRNRYRYHTNLPELFVLTSFHKEITHILRAITAIDCCLALNFNQNAQEILRNKRALLRCLSIVGEAFTQSNLTPATRSLGILSQQEIQCFLTIRNRIAHIEQNNNLNRIDHFLQNVQGMNGIINELRDLRPLLELIHQNLMQRNINPLRLHYLPADRNNPNNGMRFNQISGLLSQQVQHNQINVGNRIFNEHQGIMGLLSNAPGRQTLEDHHPEDIARVVLQQNIYQNFLNDVMARNNSRGQNIPGLHAAITNLLNIGFVPVGHNHNLNIMGPILELPLDVANGLFVDNQQMANNYLNHNFVMVANYIMQYERKMLFIRFLQQNPAIKLNIEFYFVHLVQLIGMVNPNALAPEARMFRNVMAHDNFNEILVMQNIPESFICRYLAIINQMLPALLQQLQHNQQGALVLI